MVEVGSVIGGERTGFMYVAEVGAADLANGDVASVYMRR